MSALESAIFNLCHDRNARNFPQMLRNSPCALKTSWQTLATSVGFPKLPAVPEIFRTGFQQFSRHPENYRQDDRIFRRDARNFPRGDGIFRQKRTTSEAWQDLPAAASKVLTAGGDLPARRLKLPRLAENFPQSLPESRDWVYEIKPM